MEAVPQDERTDPGRPGVEEERQMRSARAEELRQRNAEDSEERARLTQPLQKGGLRTVRLRMGTVTQFGV
jgi:hypothetical protein